MLHGGSAADGRALEGHRQTQFDERPQQIAVDPEIRNFQIHAQAFMVQNNIDLTLSWTKTMNILRSSVQYDELKKLLFSVEQNDEKKSEKKQSKKIILILSAFIG